MSFLQSDTLPIVTADVSGASAIVDRLFGTSFLISGNGLAATAAHVMEQVQSTASKSGLTACVVGKANNGASVRSVVAPITEYAYDSCGQDTCAFFTKYCAPTSFKLTQTHAEIWQRVATAGYPDEAVSGDAGSLSFNMRGQKGIVQRRISSGDVLALPNLVGYEVSMVFARGMSGSPLFRYPGEKIEVIGINVGTFESAYEIHELIDHDSSGREIRETRMSLNRYGLASDISALLQMRPHFFDGYESVAHYLSENP